MTFNKKKKYVLDYEFYIKIPQVHCSLLYSKTFITFQLN
jgi:hypothetical protein